jgi:hypothetical protein
MLQGNVKHCTSGARDSTSNMAAVHFDLVTSLAWLDGNTRTLLTDERTDRFIHSQTNS